MSMTTTGGRSIGQLRAGHTIDQSGRFDPDAWHAMNERDNALVADELMNGSLSSKFTYSFPMPGEGTVGGVSVIGARHLAAHYGGIKHRIVVSVEKRGGYHFCRTYPSGDTPTDMRTIYEPQTEADPDYYTVLVEITDVKKGNTLQAEASETRLGLRKDGITPYEKLQFQKIAQSKAYRNALLSILPQDVVIAFKTRCIELGKDVDLTADVISEKRRAILTYATGKGIPVDRLALQNLGFDQINGLSIAAGAARDGDVHAFMSALVAVGLTQAPTEEPTTDAAAQPGQAKTAPSPKTNGRRPTPAADKPAQITHEPTDAAPFAPTTTTQEADPAPKQDAPPPRTSRVSRATTAPLLDEGFGPTE